MKQTEDNAIDPNLADLRQYFAICVVYNKQKLNRIVTR